MDRMAVADRDFDIYIRTQALAALAGQRWPGDARGLAMAEQWFANNHDVPLDPRWFSTGTTGIYGAMAAAASRYLRNREDAEDLLQRVISGESLRSQPRGVIGYIAERVRSQTLRGAKGGLDKFKAHMIKHIKQRALDVLNKARPGDYGAVIDVSPGRRQEEVPHEVGSGDLLYKDYGTQQTDFRGLMSLLVSLEGSRTGRLLKQWLMKAWERGGASPALLRVGEAWLEDPADINYSRLGESLGISGNAVKKNLRKLWDLARDRYERDSNIQDFVDSQVQRGVQDFRPRFASQERIAFRFLAGRYLQALDAALTLADDSKGSHVAGSRRWDSDDKILVSVEEARAAIKRGHWAKGIKALDGLQFTPDRRLSQLVTNAISVMDDAAYEEADPRLAHRLLDAIADHMETYWK